MTRPQKPSLHEEVSCLASLPSHCRQVNENDEISLGDMHGNALKLIHLLIKEGILSLSRHDYNHIKLIYDRPVTQLSQDDLNDFEGILQNAVWKKPKLLRLLGDTLCDRGHNDYLTLLVLYQLEQQEVPYHVIMSNHDAGFIQYMAGQKPNVHPHPSLDELNFLKQSLGLQKDVNNIYQNQVIGHLKALDYSYTPGADPAITVFTHAPVGLETIAAMARYLQLNDQISSPQALMRCIDAINQEFSHAIQTPQFIKDLSNPNNPFSHLIWNRLTPGRYCFIPQPRLSTPTFSIRLVHGHVGSQEPSTANRINLDNNLGKSDQFKNTPMITRSLRQHFQPPAARKRYINQQSPTPQAVAPRNLQKKDADYIQECRNKIERMQMQTGALGQRLVDRQTIEDLQAITQELTQATTTLETNLKNPFMTRNQAYRSFRQTHGCIMGNQKTASLKNQERHRRLSRFGRRYRQCFKRKGQQILTLFANILQTAASIVTLGAGFYMGYKRLKAGKSYSITDKHFWKGLSKTGRRYRDLMQIGERSPTVTSNPMTP